MESRRIMKVTAESDGIMRDEMLEWALNRVVEGKDKYERHKE